MTKHDLRAIYNGKCDPKKTCINNSLLKSSKWKMLVYGARAAWSRLFLPGAKKQAEPASGLLLQLSRSDRCCLKTTDKQYVINHVLIIFTFYKKMCTANWKINIFIEFPGERWSHRKTSEIKHFKELNSEQKEGFWSWAGTVTSILTSIDIVLTLFVVTMPSTVLSWHWLSNFSLDIDFEGVQYGCLPNGNNKVFAARVWHWL